MKNAVSLWFTGTAYTIALVIIGSLIVSSLLKWSDMNETQMNLGIFLINGFALMVGGIIAGKKSENKGWLHGCMSGISYVILLVIIGLLAFSFSLNLYVLAFLVLAAALSTLGGMIGVNLRS